MRQEESSNVEEFGIVQVGFDLRFLKMTLLELFSRSEGRAQRPLYGIA